MLGTLEQQPHHEEKNIMSIYYQGENSRFAVEVTAGRYIIEDGRWVKVGANGRKTPIDDLPSTRPASADDDPSGDEEVAATPPQ